MHPLIIPCAHLGCELAAGRPDNLCVRFPTTVELAEVEKRIAARLPDEIVATPSDDAMENLKFGECLPPPLAV